jgi:hypothetical protein
MNWFLQSLGSNARLKNSTTRRGDSSVAAPRGIHRSFSSQTPEYRDLANKDRSGKREKSIPSAMMIIQAMQPCCTCLFYS